MDALRRLSEMPEAQLRAALLRCCGSARWAEAMLRARPFADARALHEAADRAWARLSRADWLEAFAAHPRIGDSQALRARFATTADWAAAEQGGVGGAPEAMLDALANGNREYERRFGHIFIVCATGKGAAEMLSLLRARLGNAPEQELRVAAAEQAKITRLRLDKMLAEVAP